FLSETVQRQKNQRPDGAARSTPGLGLPTNKVVTAAIYSRRLLLHSPGGPSQPMARRTANSQVARFAAARPASDRQRSSIRCSKQHVCETATAKRTTLIRLAVAQRLINRSPYIFKRSRQLRVGVDARRLVSSWEMNRGRIE